MAADLRARAREARQGVPGEQPQLAQLGGDAESRNVVPQRLEDPDSVRPLGGLRDVDGLDDVLFDVVRGPLIGGGQVVLAVLGAALPQLQPAFELIHIEDLEQPGQRRAMTTPSDPIEGRAELVP